ncbi:MAG: hypothetical protein ACM4AI_09345 [Acidobacteriota bacterium]
MDRSLEIAFHRVDGTPVIPWPLPRAVPNPDDQNAVVAERNSSRRNPAHGQPTR